MIIRVKHKQTQIEVDDVTTGKNCGMIYHNQEYVIKLLKEITDNIIKLQGDKE